VLKIGDIDIVIFKTFIVISALFEFIKTINKQQWKIQNKKTKVANTNWLSRWA